MWIAWSGELMWRLLKLVVDPGLRRDDGAETSRDKRQQLVIGATEKKRRETRTAPSIGTLRHKLMIRMGLIHRIGPVRPHAKKKRGCRHGPRQSHNPVIPAEAGIHDNGHYALCLRSAKPVAPVQETIAFAP